jgi:hypothetical protein
MSLPPKSTKPKTTIKLPNDENKIIKTGSNQKVTELVDEAKRIYATFKKQIKDLKPVAKIEQLKNEQENSQLTSQRRGGLEHKQDPRPEEGRVAGRRGTCKAQEGNEAAAGGDSREGRGVPKPGKQYHRQYQRYRLPTDREIQPENVG